MSFLWSISYLGSSFSASSSGGGTPVTIDVKTASYSSSVYDPSDASVSINFSPTGLMTVVGSGSSYTWMTVGGVPSDYEIRYSPLTGTLDIGTASVWQALGSIRSFGITRTTLGSDTASGTLEIRRVSDSLILDSATVTFTATVYEEEEGGGGPPGGDGGGDGGGDIEN